MHRWAVQAWRRSVADRPGQRDARPAGVPEPAGAVVPGPAGAGVRRTAGASAPALAGAGVPRPRGAWADLARLQAGHPMLDAVIDQVDGRRIRVGGQWLTDFASCNYL